MNPLQRERLEAILVVGALATIFFGSIAAICWLAWR